MDGLFLHLRQTGANEPRFWRLFGSVRNDLDRLHWHLSWQPWMGAPSNFDSENTLLLFDGQEITGGQLWRPGALSRYADKFREESVELWAIEATQRDPRAIAEEFAKISGSESVDFIETHADVWMIYTDSTSWEIYARKTGLLTRLRDSLINNQDVAIYKSASVQRGQAFGAAGVSHVWRNLRDM